MKTRWAPFWGAMLLGAGCVSNPQPPSGREVLTVLQNTVEASADRIGPSLTYVEVRATFPAPPSGRGGPQPPSVQQVSMTALVVSADGIVLLPIALKAETV